MLNITAFCHFLTDNELNITAFCHFLTDKNGDDFWIGANDKDLEDDCVWESDKSKLLIRDWHDGEPSGNIHCLIVTDLY
jgi:hypothetical protein